MARAIRPDDVSGSVLDAVRSVPLFSELGDDEIEAIARSAARLRFADGEVVFHQGDPGDALYVVIEGYVRVSVGSPKGQEAVLVVLGPGESFGELALLDDQPRSATIQAAGPTTVLSVRTGDFQRLVHSRPQIAIELMRVLAHRIRGTDVFYEDTAFLTVAERLAKKLLTLARTIGRPTPAGIELTVDLMQHELAAMIGATRESVSKQLIYLRQRGIVALSETNRHRLIIRDPHALRERLPGR